MIVALPDRFRHVAGCSMHAPLPHRQRANNPRGPNVRSPRALATSLVTALVLFSSIFAVTPTAIAASAVRCTDTTLPVFLTLLPQTLHGRLCTPIDRTPKT